ncbi:hypothetical protein Tco_0256493 [Tanacetum coccineum]
MARVIISDNEEDLEDSSKQRRIITEIDQNPSISLVQYEGTSWIQEDANIQGRNSADTEILLEEPTELVEDFGSGEKGEKEISTANIAVSTASAIPKVSIAGVSTAEAKLSTVIPEVSTAVENLVYIRGSAEKRKGKAIMKEDEFVNEEERQRIARDAKIAKQLQEEIGTARQEQEKSVLEKALELEKQLDEREEVIGEADPAQVIDWSDPVDPEIEKKVMKRSRFDFQKPPAKRQKIREVSGSVEDQSAGKEKEVSEEELNKLLVIVPVEEVYIKALQDLVKKKFSSTKPTVDKEKVLWVELKRLFEPDDDDTLWKLQRYIHDLLKWRLYDTCGVHHVFTERGHDIFMLVEKDYPLTRALMTVMLANKLQVDESLEMANEILRKIFYQVESPRT